MLQKTMLSLVMILVFGFGGELRGEAFFSKNKIKKERQSKTESIFDVMYQRKALTINLVFKVEEVIRNRKTKEKYPADLFFIDKNGNKHKWKIKINVRGRFRRTNCSEMPPLKLNFKKSDLKKAGLNKYDDFKLVTHCIEEEAFARTLILREYLAYKYFNILTKNSFRVQLLNINYIDSQTGVVTQHLGFMIEDLGLLRHRIGAEKCENPFGIPKDSIDKKHFKKMALFQYMIGNTDWNTTQARNLKVVKKNGKFLYIPYDFDFSGLVLAPYARIAPELKTKHLRERFYLGDKEDVKEMDATIRLFKRKSWKFRRVTRRLKVLGKVNRLDVWHYLRSFFEGVGEINLPPSGE